MIGGAARQHSSQGRHSLGPRRSAATNTAIIGSQIHGRTNSASPASVTNGANGRSCTPAARPAWNSNEAQPCVAFQASAGVNISSATTPASQGFDVASQCRCSRLDSRYRSAPAIVRIAEYFDSKASPAQSPAPNHHARSPRSSARMRQSAAPSNAQSNGPSGKTHVPVVTPNTGDRFSSTAAHSPARASAVAMPSRYISQVDNANSAMNGRRTAIGVSTPNMCAAPQLSHHETGGWS